MIITLSRNDETAARGKNRNTNDGDNNDEDEHGKRERGQSQTTWSRSPNASQSRTNRKQRFSVWKGGGGMEKGGKGPEEEKRGAKGGREAWKIPSDGPIPTKGRSRRCGTIPWCEPLLFRPDQSRYGGDLGPFLAQYSLQLRDVLSQSIAIVYSFQ